MQRVAQSWLVLTIAGSSSAFYLGLDSFLGEVPILLFTLIGGVVADRRDRRQLLLISQGVQMGSALTLAVLVYLDVVQIWHILALSVVTGMAQAFGGPAYQSLIPSLVNRMHLPNAIALNSIQFNLARVVGPLLAGAALTAFGMVACFGLNGLSFLAVIVAILALHVRHIPAPRTTRMHEELRSGLQYVRAHQGLIGLTSLGFATTFLGTPILTFLPLFAQDVFGGGVSQYTQLMAFAGAGAVTGALVVAWLGQFAHMGRTLLSLQVAFGLLVVAFRANPYAVPQRDTAVWRRRLDGHGVRAAVVARAAHRTQRDARPGDEHLPGRVSWRHATWKPGRGLDRQLLLGTDGPQRQRNPARPGGRLVPVAESRSERAVGRLTAVGRPEGRPLRDRD